MTRIRSPARARSVARFTTVVVFPTPPFWLAQAIVWPTQYPGLMSFTLSHSTKNGTLPASAPNGHHDRDPAGPESGRHRDSSADGASLPYPVVRLECTGCFT